MKYGMDLVDDYINGGELEGYDVEELENDPTFMKKVFMASGDKRLYSHCSLRVKYDYDFVCFLITRFSNDHEFIDMVVSNYLNAIKDEKKQIGVVCRMCNALKNSHDEDLYGKYRIMFLAKFMLEIILIEGSNTEDMDIGLGFCIFLEEYGYDDVILNSFAKELLSYLFSDKIDLEKELHKMLNTPKDAYNGGLMNFMINFIRRYDSMLADYAAVHLDVLDVFQEKFNKYSNKWDHYIDLEEESKYELMFENIHDFFKNYENKSQLDEDELIYFAGRELGISAKLAEHDQLDRETYEVLYGDRELRFEDILLSSMQERFIYESIKRIMRESLFGKTEDTPKEGKIIDIDFGKMKK